MCISYVSESPSSCWLLFVVNWFEKTLRDHGSDCAPSWLRKIEQFLFILKFGYLHGESLLCYGSTVQPCVLEQEQLIPKLPVLCSTRSMSPSPWVQPSGWRRSAFFRRRGGSADPAPLLSRSHLRSIVIFTHVFSTLMLPPSLSLWSMFSMS